MLCTAKPVVAHAARNNGFSIEKMSTEQMYAGTRRPPRRVPVRRTRTKYGVVTLRRNSTKMILDLLSFLGFVPTDGHFCVGGKMRDYSWAGPI